MNNNENMNQNQETQNNSGFAENIGRKLDKGLADTSEALKNNENVQKAFSAASDAGKKLDEGLTNAAQNIKNSEQYHKIMQNENVQKVMQNEHVQKAGAVWGGFGKKTKYIIGAFFLLLVMSFLFSGGKKVTTIQKIKQPEAQQCPTKCKLGKVGACIDWDYEQDGVKLYFHASNTALQYRVVSESNRSNVFTYGDGKLCNLYYDAIISGKDENLDGYVDFTIYTCSIRDEEFNHLRERGKVRVKIK